VSEDTATDTSQRALGRGRLDKRRAILDAALQVFAREGYERASVDAIAAEAAVSKPTVYNHLGGKENMFRTVMVEAAERSNAKILAVLDAFPTEPVDLRAELVTVARRLLGCYSDELSWALQRLLWSEAARFPDQYDAVRASGADRNIEALAGRLARLANAGYLTIPDPALAASQFNALITGELSARTGLGTRPIGDTDLDRLVAAGVDTFLRAFRARPAPNGGPSGVANRPA
jgi:TetR/AcrR family transcriptional repressor of mexJK operon